MTKELASGLLKWYTICMQEADKAYDGGDMDGHNEWLKRATLMNSVLSEVNLRFAKAWGGQYVIIERM